MTHIINFVIETDGGLSGTCTGCGEIVKGFTWQTTHFPCPGCGTCVVVDWKAEYISEPKENSDGVQSVSG